MEPSTTPEVAEEEQGYTSEDIEELLEWIDEDMNDDEDEDEEESYDEESTDFSDNECNSPCIECGDPSVITINNTSLCDICYEGIYRDYD